MTLAVAACVGAALDRLVGEPPLRWHPVARFGALMQHTERQVYADRRINGVVLTAAGVIVAACSGVALRALLGPGKSAALATTVCVAGKMLDSEAASTAELLARGDLDGARERARALVGRDTAALDATELSRAAIESLAENCVDAVTAPMLWAAVGGAPAVAVHRALNTLDAMIGHRDQRYRRFGWAAARLDDAANYVPARVTALAVAFVRPHRAMQVWRVVRRDARVHPSPNGGVVEAAFAAALDLRLGGSNRYGTRVEHRGTLGSGRTPTVSDIEGAIRLRRHTTIAVAAVLLLAGRAARLKVPRPVKSRG